MAVQNAQFLWKIMHVEDIEENGGCLFNVLALNIIQN
jgi:hypothetical protein